MKKTPIIISAIILVVALLVVGIYFGFVKQSALQGGDIRIDYTYSNLVGSDDKGATYDFGYELVEPIDKSEAIGCGTKCSYEFVKGWSPQTNEATPINVENLKENVWVEGITTNQVSLSMLINKGSDNERPIPAIVNNTKSYFMKSGNTYSQKHSGDVYSSNPNLGGHYYGSLDQEGKVTIPKKGVDCLIDIHCNEGEECRANSCVEVCIPQTCEDIEMSCGVYSNGCLGSLNCGTCDEGMSCSFGECVDNPPEPNTKLIMIIAISLIVIFLVIIAVVIVRRRK